MQGYHSVTVGIDFSPVCEAALFHAARIAAWSNAPLAAAHVIDTALLDELADSGNNGAPDGDRAALLVGFRRRLATLTANRAPGIDIALEVDLAPRAAGLLDIAARHDSDLLVVGNPDDGREEVGDLLRACVRRATADALIVRDIGHHPFRRIVAAVDLEADSAGVVDRAACMARYDGAELVVAFVHDDSAQAGLRGLFGSRARQDREQKAILCNRLVEMAKPCLASLPAERVSFHVALDADYPVRVSDLADAQTADLLVIGYRRHGWLHDWLTASTAEAVVGDSLFSVLVAKV